MATGRAVPDTSSTADRRAVKRQRREAQIAVRQRLEQSERRRKRIIWGTGIFLSIAALVALGWWLFGPIEGGEVQRIPIQGREHIERTQGHPPYNSTPPTSGWHYGDAVAPWGVSREPIANEVQVHNLEHGGILIQYDCPEGCPDIVSRLETIVRSYPSKVLLAPYPDIPNHRIAVTAWGRIAYLDEVNEPFIRQFIQRFKDKGPEFVPDM
ncbi:MAG TPA: DUF3105 domain-containing protein [Chloroflexota bacterium]|nr:DUF3105 domain-containing protein [Chloroflexota bacterium]